MKMYIDTVMFRPHPVGKAGQLIQFFPPPPPSMLELVLCSVGWCLYVVGSCCLGKSAQLATFARSLFERSERGNWGGVGSNEEPSCSPFWINSIPRRTSVNE